MGARNPSTALMVSTESTESLTDMINLLLRGSYGGDSPGSFLAVHPSVSVSYKVLLSEPGWDNLTYAPVRVDTTREGVGEEVERDAGENFLSSVSFDITVAIFFSHLTSTEGSSSLHSRNFSPILEGC